MNCIIRASIRICICFFVGLAANISKVSAATVNGRVTLGGYAAQEKFVDNSAGSTRNDFLTASARYYLRVGEFGQEKNWQFTTDLRDKHDFFDKLNRERLELDPVNTFQTRELNLKYISDSKRSFTAVGRFPVNEAGNVHCDGALVGLQPSPRFSFGLFGGLNPKRPDQQYVAYNQDSHGYGVYGKFQSQEIGWTTNAYASVAFVQQDVAGEVDRKYFYNNFLYQWSARSRIFNMLYVDFEPRTYIQTGFLSWTQGISRIIDTEIALLGIDVIEYSRRQGVRERLSSSPYREGMASIKLSFSPRQVLKIDHILGIRDADNLKKMEWRLKYSMPRFFSPNWDSSFRLATRENFTSVDKLGGFSFGYFSEKGEIAVDLGAAVEEYTTGEVLHPTMVELSLGFIFSKRFFGALVLGQEKDERVEINSGFFKISYRFGNQEIPPIRDGAPPRGTL